MGRSCYSETFCVQKSASGASHFVVPAGKRAVIKAVSGITFTNPGGYVECVVNGVWIVLFFFPGPNTSFYKEQFAVAYAGQQIDLVTNGALCHAMVSGYLLEDTPEDPAGRPTFTESEGGAPSMYVP